MSIVSDDYLPFATHADSMTDFEREPGGGDIIIHVTVASDYYAGHEITIPPEDWAAIVNTIGA